MRYSNIEKNGEIGQKKPLSHYHVIEKPHRLAYHGVELPINRAGL